jgi:hypothetical protein
MIYTTFGAARILTVRFYHLISYHLSFLPLQTQTYTGISQEAVRFRFHNAKIAAQKVSLNKLVVEWENKGEITTNEKTKLSIWWTFSIQLLASLLYVILMNW